MGIVGGYFRISWSFFIFLFSPILVFIGFQIFIFKAHPFDFLKNFELSVVVIFVTLLLVGDKFFEPPFVVYPCVVFIFLGILYSLKKYRESKKSIYPQLPYISPDERRKYMASELIVILEKIKDVRKNVKNEENRLRLGDFRDRKEPIPALKKSHILFACKRYLVGVKIVGNSLKFEKRVYTIKRITQTQGSGLFDPEQFLNDIFDDISNGRLWRKGEPTPRNS